MKDRDAMIHVIPQQKTSSKTVASMISEVSHVPSGFGDLAEGDFKILALRICLLILKGAQQQQQKGVIE